MKLNRKQKTVLFWGLAVFMLMGFLSVPYQHFSSKGSLAASARGTLFSPPVKEYSIPRQIPGEGEKTYHYSYPMSLDTTSYLIQQGMIAAVCVGLVFLFADSKDKREE